MHWTDPAVQSAIIQAIAAVLTAIAAAVIGKEFINRKKLQKHLALAQQDIAFLLAVEEEHCKFHLAMRGESFKNRMRDKVRARNLTWSGHFTPGRANDSPTIQKARLALAESLSSSS